MDNKHFVDEFLHIYQNLNKDNLTQLSEIYHPDITFIDPLHQVNGLIELTYYFENLYANLSSCQFVVQDQIIDNTNIALYWQMTYVHPKLNKGQAVEVMGHSRLITQDGKVIYHRDYLDAGTMLYEQIPLLGSAIRFIKKRASQ